MATLTAVPPVLGEQFRDLVAEAKLLVVGAGGIGCEILKNLALSGFRDIEIVRLCCENLVLYVPLSFFFSLCRLIWIQLMLAT